jgi:hypothetical protein
MKLHKIVLVIFLMATCLIHACVSTRTALYGSWQVETSTDLQAQGLGDLIFEFRKDGTLGVTIEGVTVDFLYDFVDDDTIRFAGGEGQIPSLLSGQELDFVVTGDTLSLISNGESVHFTRMMIP